MFQISLTMPEDKTWSANLLITGDLGFGGFALCLLGVMGRSGVLKSDMKWRGVVVDDAEGSSVQYCLRMFKIIRPVAHIVLMDAIVGSANPDTRVVSFLCLRENGRRVDKVDNTHNTPYLNGTRNSLSLYMRIGKRKVW